jgi:aspartate/methionine/tyrosine aminotransferase
MMMPNYMEISGLAETFGGALKSFWLREQGNRWAPDLEGLKKTVTPKTKLIAICNPNNPTGTILSEEELDAICEIAEKVGAWVLSDEAYQGTEIDGKPAPTLWGRC